MSAKRRCGSCGNKLLTPWGRATHISLDESHILCGITNRRTLPYVGTREQQSTSRVRDDDGKEVTVTLDKVHVYKDSSGEWRWTRRNGSNGLVVADSGEGYTDRSHAVEMAHAVNGGSFEVVIINEEGHEK